MTSGTDDAGRGSRGRTRALLLNGCVVGVGAHRADRAAAIAIVVLEKSEQVLSVLA